MSDKPAVITDPLTNRGTAFTLEQRCELGLISRLPSVVETPDEQARRAYTQLCSQSTGMARYISLDQLHNRNEVFYYWLLVDHLQELLPVVYDPTVGDAIKGWSHDCRRPRVVYLSIDRPEDIRVSFESLGLRAAGVDLLVCPDAEEILSTGDWGVNGTDISVGKPAVYTAAAGTHLARAIAISLDCGTDNQQLLGDPAYFGNRHPRIRGERYDAFIAEYLRVVSELFPRALLYFEDFGPSNARRILERYRGTYRVFNDDMQGTGAIATTAMISGMKVTDTSFADQQLVVYGVGTAGTGMADQIHAGMARDGLSETEVRSWIWLIDRDGLVTDNMPDLPDYQQVYARPAVDVANRERGARGIGLLEVMRRVKPTILIGTFTDHDTFTQDVIEALCVGADRPIMLPLSNPTERIEVIPADVIVQSDGRALVTAGIPVEDVEHDSVTYTIGQGNNALLYPGLGLGAIVSGAREITDGMLLTATEAVASQVDPLPQGAALLPPVHDLRVSSTITAKAAARCAEAEGVASRAHGDLARVIKDAVWEPIYGSWE